MLIPLLCALLLSPAASAAESFSRTEIARLPSIPNARNRYNGGTFVQSADGKTALAIASNKIVSAWDTLTGVQKVRFEYSEPSVEPDAFDLAPMAVSPDGAYAILMYAQYRGPKDDEKAREGRYKLLLADLKQEKIVRTLFASDYGPMSRGGIMTFIPQALFVNFRNDGKTFTTRLQSFPAPEYNIHIEDVKFDLAGHRSSLSKPDGALLNGRLADLRADDTSCELIDSESGKRLSFLQDCTERSNPGFSTDKPRAYSSTDGDFRLWDTTTGKLLYRHDFKKGSESSRYITVLLAEDGRHLLVFNALTDENARLEVWTTADEKIHSEEFTIASYGGAYGGPYSLGGELIPGNVLLHEALPTQGGANYHVQLVVEKLDFGGGPAVAAAAAPVPLIDVDSPPATKAALDPDAYAVVIGVEKYRQEGIPPVDFAARDAQTMYSYLTGAMGFDPKNVILLTDAQATRTDLQKDLKWLSNRATAKSRVFVYYAGHGSPNPETGEGYLMPYEADPSYLEETAFPIAKLYASLGNLPTKDVTVVLDACFSGQGHRSLIAKGTRPLVSVVQSKAEPNTMVLAAAGSNQVSASYPAARHGLLTYYLLAGLHGEADAKHDGRITSEELIDYVRPAVERAAKLQNVEQTPSLMSPAGAASRTWIVLTPKK